MEFHALGLSAELLRAVEARGYAAPTTIQELAIPAILDEARKHGFAGNVSIEYESNWHHNLPEVGQCVGYLRAYSTLRP